MCPIRNHGLGVDTDRQPGRLKHEEIVCTVPQGRPVPGCEPQPRSMFAQESRLGRRIHDRARHPAGQAAVSDFQLIGMPRIRLQL